MKLNLSKRTAILFLLLGCFTLLLGNNLGLEVEREINKAGELTKSLLLPVSGNNGKVEDIKNEKYGNAWQNVGLWGGDIEELVQDTQDTDIFYAIGRRPYISTDGGETWEIWTQLDNLFNSLEGAASIDCFAIGNDGVMYVSIYGSGENLFRSTDSGETWFSCDFPIYGDWLVHIGDIIVDANNSDILYVGVGYTGDQEVGSMIKMAIWNPTTETCDWIDYSHPEVPEALYVSCMDKDPNDVNTMLVGFEGDFNAGGYLLGTQDCGVTWVDCTGTGIDIRAGISDVDVRGETIYIASGSYFWDYSVGLQKSTNFGQNWDFLSGDFPCQIGRSVTTFEANNDKIILGTDGDGVYISEDGGENWDFDHADNAKPALLVKNIVDENHILAACKGRAVIASNNGGDSWLNSNSGICMVQINQVSVNPTNPYQMLAVYGKDNNGCVYYSNDGGQYWEIANLPAVNWTLCEIDENGYFYAFSQGPGWLADDGLYKSTDGGQTWENTGPNPQTPNLDNEIYGLQISPNNPEEIYMGGTTWTGGTGRIFRTTNGGEEWNIIYENEERRIVDIAFTTSEEIYAIYNQNYSEYGVIKSTDYGETWQDMNDGIQNTECQLRGIDYDPNNAGHLFVLGRDYGTYSGQYWETTDGGHNWAISNIENSTQSFNQAVFNSNNSDIIYINSTSGYVVTTVDGGETWFECIDGLERVSWIRNFSNFYTLDNTDYILAGTEFNGIFYNEVFIPTYSEVEFTVTSTAGEGLENANIILSNDDISYNGTTNADGNIVIQDVMCVEYELTVSLESYNAYQDICTISESGSNIFDITLTQPGLSVNPTSLEIEIGVNDQQTEYLTIENTGTGMVELSGQAQFEDEIEELITDYDLDPAYCYPQATAYDGQNIWIAYSNEEYGGDHQLVKYDTEGNEVQAYSQNISGWGIRGMIYVEPYLYLGTSNGFYQLDPETMQRENLFMGLPDVEGISMIRALGYVPNLGFIAKDGDTDIYIFNETGEVLATYPLQADFYNDVRGLNYDEHMNCLWILERYNGIRIHQYDLTTKQLTGFSFDIPSSIGNNQIASSSVYCEGLYDDFGYIVGTTYDSFPASELHLFVSKLSPLWISFPQYSQVLEAGEIGQLSINFDSNYNNIGDVLQTTLQVQPYPNVGSINIPVEVTVQETGLSENNVPFIAGINKVCPNPFNPSTTISFAVLNDNIPTEMDVYNIKGQKVKTLINDVLERGQHDIIWNGKNNSNNNVASGVYFLKLKNGKYHTSRKILLLK
jgi:photosystem II stability/assembly factor-like uncharacterized protein